MKKVRKKKFTLAPEFIRAAEGNYELALAAHKLVLSLRGKASKKKGGSSEDASMAFVLSHYGIYKVPDKEHIYFTPRGTRFHKDLFCVEYTEKMGKKNKAGFDLICLTEEGDISVHLIQVKTNRTWSKAYEEALRGFRANERINKELHLWEDDKLTVIPLCSKPVLKPRNQ